MIRDPKLSLWVTVIFKKSFKPFLHAILRDSLTVIFVLEKMMATKARIQKSRTKNENEKKAQASKTVVRKNSDTFAPVEQFLFTIIFNKSIGYFKSFSQSKNKVSCYVSPKQLYSLSFLACQCQMQW